MIEGLNFSGQTKKLRRNYRNPFPVYAAGLALMFRWLAANGPKIIPSQTQLKDEFGFDEASVADTPGGSAVLKKWNDSHPGNYWSFTTSTFFSCEDAYAQLGNAGLSRRDVLWVRFREEEEGFDYEKLLRFTYHNVHSGEAFDLVDKYVKGQEFSVVVIEGFPALANRSEFSETMDDAEKDMWKARRQLYLCCSRSTAFLYFVLPSPEGGQFKGLAAEILDLVKQVSTPELPAATTKRIWRVQFYRTSTSRTVDDFQWEGRTAEPQKPSVEAQVNAPVTVRRLSAALNVDAGTLFTALFARDFLVKFSTDVVPDDLAREIALEHGVILRITAAPQPTSRLPPAVTSEVTQDVLPLTSNAPKASSTAPATPIAGSSRPLAPVGSLDSELDTYLDGPSFPRYRLGVDKYLAIIAWVVEKHPRGRDVALRQRGRLRRYFAASVEDIERTAQTPNVKRLGAAGLFALTTSSDELKGSITDRVLRECGFGLAVREKAVRMIRS